MRSYLESTLKEYDFPTDSHADILAAYDALMQNEISSSAINKIISDYESGENPTFDGVCNKITEVAEAAGTHPYSAALATFLLLTRHLRTLYENEGYTEEMYRGVISDLKYKLIECRLVKGINGTFVATWFPGFFALRRFCFGRLQFELHELKFDYNGQGISIPEGTNVINVHIPRTGGRLDAQSCKESYAAAAEFFGKKYGVAPVFRCSSWLLFPKHKEILKPESNIIGFMSDYDIAKSGTYADYKEIWRLFDTDYTGNPDDLPAESSMRRAYIALMKSGEPTGWGEGIYVFKK